MHAAEPTQTILPLLHEVTGTGDPIVLVPGILTGWASWKDHAVRLAERHTVVRVQVRSVELAEACEPIPPDYSIAMERDALLATVNALGLSRFDLVGWSLGGLISLAFTLQQPERVRTLTVIEPAAGWVLQETGHAWSPLRDLEAFQQTFSNREISEEDLTTFLVMAGMGRPGTDFTTHPRWPLMVRNRQVLSTLSAIDAHSDSLERLRALNAPILAVRGMDSTEVDRAIVGDIVANAPNTTLLELPGDHACHLQNPDRFLAALEAHASNETGA